MKLIIAGGRDYVCHFSDALRLNVLHRVIKVTEVISGKAKGADTCGESWAISQGIPVKEFKPDWKEWGKAAGGIRNIEMGRYSDAVVLFPGDTGTQDMYDVAREFKLVIYDWR